MEAQILQLFELSYSDLKQLSSQNGDSSSSPEEQRKLESLSRTIMETLGPNGPGLLSVTGVPNASSLRARLLPLARRLALLNDDDRKRILKEHNLGSDVPLKNLDRIVSSFATQLKYVQLSEFSVNKPNPEVDKFGDFWDDGFKNLGDTLRELGFCMMELGLCLARVCDRAFDGQELEQSLLESCTAKGRLIHYHSAQDNLFLKEAGRRKRSNKKLVTVKRDERSVVDERSRQGPKSDNGNEARSCGIHSNLWQQWHYDYGIFTILTAPLFLLSSRPQETETIDHFSSSCDQESPYPSGHSCLQIFNPNRNNVLLVNTSPESFIIQVGESADVLSKGRLRSTLHSVCRPAKSKNLCRETFVVFLQPAWSKTFSLKDYPMKHLMFGGQCRDEAIEEHVNGLTNEIHKIVPPLLSRLKDGMTFAEFSRETTKQYYGGSGLQSNR